MEKEFIPYEQAVVLKELGFDEPCFGLYGKSKGTLFNLFKVISEKFDDVDDLHFIKAPLYQQAFRWFREKYSLNSFIIDSKSYNWYFNINDMVKDDVISEVLYFNTYEEAKLECLKKLIEIVKKK